MQDCVVKLWFGWCLVAALYGAVLRRILVARGEVRSTTKWGRVKLEICASMIIPDEQ